MASATALTFHILNTKIQTLRDATGQRDADPFAALGLLAQAQQFEEERERIRIVVELEEARATSELPESLAAANKAFEDKEQNERNAAAARRREQRAAAERKEKDAARDKARREATRPRVKAYRGKKRAALEEEAYRQMVSTERQWQRLNAKANTKKKE